MLFLQCLNKENCYLGISLFFLMLSLLYWAYPGSSDGKESAFNVGDLGLIPGLGRSPGKGKGNPFQYSGQENSVHGVAKSQTRLSDFHYLVLSNVLSALMY